MEQFQLPEPVLAGIRRSDLAQMDGWIERRATAQAFKAVFSDGPCLNLEGNS